MNAEASPQFLARPASAGLMGQLARQAAGRVWRLAAVRGGHSFLQALVPGCSSFSLAGGLCLPHRQATSRIAGLAATRHAWIGAQLRSGLSMEGQCQQDDAQGTCQHPGGKGGQYSPQSVLG
ncbi:MAG: hypothetical protein WC073_12475 [Sterolibacterium sp.]